MILPPSILSALYGANGILLASALFLAVLALCNLCRSWRAHLRPRRILSANETEFFYRLSRALPACHIFPQVSFSALITVESRLSAKQCFNVRRRFGWKYADFVICERKTLRVLAVVELDDRTHHAQADRKRDRLLFTTGYRVLRFQSKAKPTEAEIAALFQA